MVVRSGGTLILVNCVVSQSESTADFFPLTVNYTEKYYAAGKIPGGFLKREAKATDKETLIARLIDRPIRPLFAKEFMQEVQITCNVLSYDPNDLQTDIAAILGTSACLALLDIPFSGPVGGVRVGYSAENNSYLLNPNSLELKNSKLDMVVAGTESAILMVESEAGELVEDVLMGALEYAQKFISFTCNEINKFVSLAGGKSQIQWTPQASSSSFVDKISADFTSKIAETYAIRSKKQRNSALSALRKEAVAKLCEGQQDPSSILEDAKESFSKVEKDWVRNHAIRDKKRIDGRAMDEVRPISIQLDYLPKAHGSAVFTRGETQALVVVTLGTLKESQLIDDIVGNRRDNLMFQYNFPPFSVGEVGRVGAPKRREIGHGNLARRGISAVLPSVEEFPYSLRIVSEILESNGSSSMASICGSSLALMQTGVPLRKPVAGIAMGLVKEGDDFVILSDISGDEDHLGDMDFKVGGTRDGITTLQMDIKIQGITFEIMKKALEQAKAGRMHILGEMAKSIENTKDDLSENAPKIVQFKIDQSKIREVIGKGGSVIQEIIRKTGTEVEISDEGVVSIYAKNQDQGAEAEDTIRLIAGEPDLKRVYNSTIKKIAPYGLFVNIAPGKDGLVHVSEMSQNLSTRFQSLNLGDKLDVKILSVDDIGRLKLTTNF